MGSWHSSLRRARRPSAQANVPGSWWQLGHGQHFWLLLAPTAIVAGAVGAGLKVLLRVVEHASWAYRSGPMAAAVSATTPLHRVATLAVAGAMAGAVWWAMQRWWGTRGGGMTDRIWSRKPDMDVGPTLTSAALSTTIIAMGASLGREAPPKEAAAALASWIGQWAKLSHEEQILLVACAAGGAWAAIYNIPFAGGVFAAEVLVGTLTLPVVVPAVAVSALATALSQAVLPVHPYYVGVPAFPDSVPLLVWAVVAGPVLGVAATGFVRLLGLANVHRVSGRWLLVGPLVAFVGLGVVSIWYPLILGNGRDIGQALFLHGMAPGAVVALLLLKPVVTVGCWGSGASGGMFTPLTSYGALVGALFGSAWSQAWHGVPAGAFALVGASAVVTAGMAAPLSGIALMWELTGGHLTTLLLPVLLAASGAAVTAHLLGGGSIYSVRLPLDGHQERWQASGTWATRPPPRPIRAPAAAPEGAGAPRHAEDRRREAEDRRREAP